LDGLEPFLFVQAHILDEGVEVLREAQHDLTQTGVGSALEAAEHFGGDVVFGGEAGFYYW